METRLETVIRNERPEDYRAVEELTKKAFWNVNAPGCDEHYLAHVLRDHRDFVPELDFVLEMGGKLVGNIMYTRSLLRGGNGGEKTILTFGPLSVLPDYQRLGFGKALMEHSFKTAAALGYEAVVIFGNPENYIPRGFKSCKKYGVSIGGVYPVPLLVKELREGALSGERWTYIESEAYNFDRIDAKRFDADFEQMSEEYRPSQELFFIYSNSRMN